MVWRRICCFGLALIFRLLPLKTAMANCRDATDTYNSAISDVSDTLKRYARCVSGSNGQDDCSSEFRRLKNAQSDFESPFLNTRANAISPSGLTLAR